MKKRYHIGIDPDIKKSGIAVWDSEEKEFVELTASNCFSYSFTSKLEVIESYPEKSIVFYIDAGWLNQKSNYHPAQGANIRERIANKVGQNHGYGMAIAEYLKSSGYEVVEVQPTKQKTSFETFNQFTKNKYLDNFKRLMTYKQEIVDAAMLCYGR